MNKILFLQLIVLFNLPVSSCNSGNNLKPDISDSSKIAPSKNKAEEKAYKYDLLHPQKKWKLQPDLVEISGNTWIDENHLLVIEDLHPDLYLLRLDADSASIEKKIPFRDESPDKKFDVEDVTIVNNTVYALWSHGAVFKINNWQEKPDTKEIKTFLSKENNTEGICYDPVTKNLLVTCKNESDVQDEKKSTRAVYEYDVVADTLKTQPFMLIHKKDFKKETGEKLEFFPSAIAVHPVTHDIYILTTRDNKGMAIFSHEGVLKGYLPIEKELMQQPEGICFSPDGKLYISSEGKKGEPGNLFEFDPKTR